MNRIKPLRYEAELISFIETIEAYYRIASSEDVVFRSTLTDPPTLKDSIPQSKRENEDGIEEEEIILSEEEIAALTEGEKKEFVGSRGLSVYKSYEKCIADIKFWINRIAGNYSREEAEAYLNERRGPFMVKLQLSAEAGLIEKKFNKKGHKNVLLNEGELIDNYIIATYAPLSIEELLEESVFSETSEGNLSDDSKEE